ncbi:MAG: DUF6869 domain-containing protein [Hyphomicrobium sp.]
MELPNCLDCKYAEQGFPCHKADGSFDFAKVGTAVVLHGRTYGVDGENIDPSGRDEHAWAADCAFEVEQDYPHLLIPLTVAAMDACETANDAAYVAAGLLENAVVKHGPLLIDQIEALAKHSAKFRYFLSAIWGQVRTDPGVWTRVCAAVGTHGLMDDDGRCPSSGEGVTVLTADEAQTLLRERIWPAMSKLGIA